jgi:hypothetical protein
MILRLSFNAKLATLLLFAEIAPSPLLAHNTAQQLPLGSWKRATTRLHSLKPEREQQDTPSLLS